MVIFLDYRTDLAIERGINNNNEVLKGVEQYRRGNRVSVVTEIRITDEDEIVPRFFCVLFWTFGAKLNRYNRYNNNLIINKVN